ncbi:reverse transcriptase domain-containing protein [Tanacetum coccineum]
MTNGREMTSPPGFSTPPHTPNINTNERPHVTTTVFAATTPGNTPFAYRASTSTDPTPMISPAFIEANYEILESLLRDRRRQTRNEDYDEERFKESPNRERSRTGRNTEGNRPLEAGIEENERREMNLPLLLAAHLGRNENGQPLQSSLTSVHGGRQSLINIEGNLPPNGTLLSHHAQPFIPSSAHVPNGFITTHANPYSQPSAGIINGQTPSFLFQAQTGLFADLTGYVTPFVRWIEDYPLPYGLKMPSHVGSYDGKGDPNNFLHLFEGAFRMQKWLMPVACHVFTYTLKDSARIWWNSQKAVSILNYKDLKAKFRSHFSQQKRFTKTHLAVHNIKQREGESVRAFATRYTDDTLQILGLHEDQSREVATNGAPNDQRDNFKRSRKSSLDNGRGQKSRDRFSPYWGPNHGFLSSLSKSPREILTIEKIEEAVKSGQLSHLVKGNKKERAKTFDNQRGEKKEKSTTPAEAPILMINQEEACTGNSISKSPAFKGREITFPTVMKGSNSSAPVVIKAKIFRREVGRVHRDSGSSCEDIYEHCFLKLKPSIQASKVDLKVPLVGFSREKSWAIREVLLEITIGETPLSRRTSMQKMGMVVSTIYEAIKFHTTQGIGNMFSTYESDKIKEGVKKIRETSPANTEGVLRYTDAKEKIVVNSKYPEQTVTIGKQLPEHFKKMLRNLLRTNANVFVWTHAGMMGIPKTITVDRKPFNT